MGIRSFLESKRVNKIKKVAMKAIEKESQYINVTDGELRNKFIVLQDEYNNTSDEEALRVDTLALVREAAKRVLGLEAYPVQLVGALILSEGNVAEMKTGEGKTLVSLFAICLEVVSGSKVHLITANEYLAERDKNEIGKVLEFLGVKVGLNSSLLSLEEKKLVYECGVIYGTASEFGFDYLKDNMASHKSNQVQNGLEFVLIDEADSILIDEARTPLIISGKKEEDLSLYQRANFVISNFSENDFIYNRESNSVWMSEEGILKAQKLWKVEDLYQLENQELLRSTNLLLRAHYSMTRDKDYVVDNGEVKLIDPNTGRIMEGRRFSDGLHQAIEAKEKVEVKDETMTLATITIQNYFRMYQKIAGMTGTAKTEEEELQKIYGMDVVVVPTHRPVSRMDDQDEIYLTKELKAKAIVKEVKERNSVGQPVLVGTASIEDNEWLSEIFKKERIPHEVLNAKNHEREAEIITNAGMKGAVTLATNMAGRGTDIKIDDEVRELGGLAVIGTEKLESRRIDNQLKGRSGRQGDPGYSKFILSLEDDLIKRFNLEKVKQMIQRFNFPEDEPIRNKMITKVIESGQKRMESVNYDSRKNLLEYDEVMDLQRKFVYGEREKVLGLNSTKEFTIGLIEEFVVKEIDLRFNEDEPDKVISWVINELTGAVEKTYLQTDDVDELKEKVLRIVLKNYEKKITKENEEIVSEIEKSIFKELLDKMWVRHLDQLQQLKEGIHLRSYGQENPLVEYQKEAAAMFQNTLDEIQDVYSQTCIKLKIEQIIKG